MHTRDDFFKIIKDGGHSFASSLIAPFDESFDTAAKPFAAEYIWEDDASINVYLVGGTRHPDYIGMTWAEFLQKGKRMSINIPLAESNPSYYFANEKKLPTMSYIQIDGGSYYVDADGNHRTCIARFLYFLERHTKLHGVSVSRYRINRALQEVYCEIKNEVAARRLPYVVEPVTRCVSREDTPSWMREVYDPKISVRDCRKGIDSLLGLPEGERFLEHVKRKRWLFRS